MKTRTEKNKEIQNKITKEKYQKKMRIIIKVFSIIFIFCFSIITYGIFIGAKSIVINEKKITSNLIPINFHGLKLVHFSDLLYDSLNQTDLKNIQTKINKLKPDILVFTGDIQKKDYELTKNDIELLNNFFQGLHSSIKKYAIKGNQDTDIFQVIMENSNFTILNNQEDLLYYQDLTPLKIVGFDSNKLSFDNIKDENYYTICLIHNPDKIDLIKTKCHLTLAGDTLGGEIKIPFIKGLFTNHKYNKEYYKLHDNQIYISNGLGNNYKIRLFNRPNINLYRLTSY